MNLDEIKNELLKDDEFKVEYEKLHAEYVVARTVLKARKEMQLTKEQLSDITGIDVDKIDKLELETSSQTIILLNRITEALNMKLHIEFLPKQTDLDNLKTPNDITKKAIEATKNGIGLSSSFNSVNELMDDLNDIKFPNAETLEVIAEVAEMKKIPISSSRILMLKM